MSPGRALILVENLSVPFDRRVWQEASALRAHGWDVEVICPKGTRTDREPESVVDGVRVHRFPLTMATGGPRGYVAEYGTALWHMLRLALRARARGRIDVVHLCNPPDLLFVVGFVLRLLGARVVFDQHDLCPELYLSRFGRGRDALYRLTRVLEWLTYRVADVVISTNDSYRAVATGRGGVPASRVVVVRSAPDTARFRPVQPDPALRRGREHLLCYLGVMGPQDGVDRAVRALAEPALRARQDWHAAFVGDGDARGAAMKLAAELGIADRVTFTGRVPDDDLLRHLSTAAVCLAPDPPGPLNDVSTMNKILEYMAVGRPTVSFDLVEARVSAGDAAVYATDVAGFAALVGELLDDPARRERMGRAGRERISGPLSWSCSERELLRAYAIVGDL